MWYYDDMDKYLRIINIDGTRGCGRSTQSRFLMSYFGEKGIECIVNNTGDTVESNLDSLNKSLEFLKKNEYGVVINDGTPIRLIVNDLIDGTPLPEAMQKYKELLSKFKNLQHEYGKSNLLLIMDDIQEANRRLLEKAFLMGLDDKGIEDQKRERKIVDAMKTVNSHVITNGIDFDRIDVLKTDSMIQLHEIIVEYLEKNYEIKKPL